MKRLFYGVSLLAAGLLLAASAAWANNLVLTNFSLVNNDSNAGSVDLQFDLSWENSWRASWEETDTGAGSISVSNHDAVWVFVKYRAYDERWHHVRLAASGHSAPAGMTIELGASGSGTNVGAFIYRSAEGYGNINLSNVRLHWNYAEQGLPSTNMLDICVHATEMVYIPEGAFWVGDGTAVDIAGQFEDGNTGNPLRITSEGQITLGGGAAGSLGNHDAVGMDTADDFNYSTTQTLPAAYPKGYQAFYCMKYEITEDQYSQFLNQLLFIQAGLCELEGNSTKYTSKGGDWPNYTNGSPERAQTCVGHTNILAYMNWAGLRPMTELEYEKACRGPKTPVANEHAWGNTNLVMVTTVTSGGTGREMPGQTNANCHSTHSFAERAVRVGMFARTNAWRALSGAGYYGVLDLSGNVMEAVVTLGQGTGRSFNGIHGDGEYQTVPVSWPIAGRGYRGGGWQGVGEGKLPSRVSDRSLVVKTYATGEIPLGGRGVRTAP